MSRFGRLTSILLIVMIAALAVTAAQAQPDARVAVKPTTTVSVPNVVGMSVKAAGVVLSARSLTLVADAKTQKQGPTAIIRAQRPGPAMKVPAGTAVTVTVSATSLLITIPNIVGMTEFQAFPTLDKAGLRYQDDSNEEFPSGAISAQEPAAGVRVQPGTLVLASYSQVRVPRLIGYGFGDATALAQKAALRLASKPVNPARAARVTKQQPPAGTLLKRDGIVTVVFGLPQPAQRLVRVPELRGLAVPDARKMTTAVGLDLTIANAKLLKGVDTGAIVTVRDQNPPAGTEVSLQTSVVVDIQVRVPPSALVLPNLIGTSASEARTILAALSLGMSPENEESKNLVERSQGTVVRQHPPANTKVLQGSSVVLALTAPAPPRDDRLKWVLIGGLAAAALAAAAKLARRRPRSPRAAPLPKPVAFSFSVGAGESETRLLTTPDVQLTLSVSAIKDPGEQVAVFASDQRETEP